VRSGLSISLVVVRVTAFEEGEKLPEAESESLSLNGRVWINPATDRVAPRLFTIATIFVKNSRVAKRVLDPSCISSHSDSADTDNPRRGDGWGGGHMTESASNMII
jgi:hypothetical protein